MAAEDSILWPDHNLFDFSFYWNFHYYKQCSDEHCSLLHLTTIYRVPSVAKFASTSLIIPWGQISRTGIARSKHKCAFKASETSIFILLPNRPPKRCSKLYCYQPRMQVPGFQTLWQHWLLFPFFGQLCRRQMMSCCFTFQSFVASQPEHFSMCAGHLDFPSYELLIHSFNDMS